MYRIQRQSKYKNKSAEYGGRKYDSIKEAAYAQELDLRKHANLISDWEPQVRISLDANNKHICNYIVDFRVTYPDGQIELVEVKGFATEVWRLKVKIMEATYLMEHPEVEYLVVR